MGHGAEVFPNLFHSVTTSRQAAATCGGCAWQLEPMCLAHSSDAAACAGLTQGCPVGEERDRVLRRLSADAVWVDVGDVCIGGTSQPITVADAAVRVRDRFVDRLPRPRPSSQPPNGALTNLPTVFASGQHAGLDSDDFTLLSMPVHVDARPAWTWDFGDGSTLQTTNAGGRYPDTDVAHMFRSPGSYYVAVRTRWEGTFTVDGLGPFDVTGGPVTQQAVLTVTVRDASARLVG